jgi:AbrB family looped-hinge helix DNA binding protein
MPATTLTSKGQVTIPLALRKALGLHAGSRLDFVQEGASIRVVPLGDASTALKGRFAGRVSAPVSLAQMDQAIAQQAAARIRKAKK